MLLDASGRPLAIIPRESSGNQVSLLQFENERLRESFAELELAMEDIGWVRFGHNVEKDFTPSGRRLMLQLCRFMFLKNPLINRGVLIKSIYVWAQGCTVTSEDETVKATLDAHFDDPENQREMYSHQARTLKEQELEVTGDLYFVLFAALDTARTVIRTVSSGEITKTICDPEDSKRPWLYLREWTQKSFDLSTGVESQQPRKAYYPDWMWEPEAMPASIGGINVMWDSPVYHVAIGALPDMQKGIPEIYQAIDWARAYTLFLEDWASITRAYARFAWDYNTKGGAKAVNAASSALSTTIGAADQDAWDRQPPPLSASTIITSGDNSMKPIRTSGATTSAEDGRHLKLMVCAAFGFPETFFGDVSIGNHATARTLDRPTELNIKDRQELWRGIYENIGRWVVAKASKAVRGILFTVDNPKLKSVHCNFPPILEQDIAETINAHVAVATLAGSQPGPAFDLESFTRATFDALGYQNVDDIVKRLLLADAEAKQAAIDNPQPVQPNFVKSLESFKEELIRFHERAA